MIFWLLCRVPRLRVDLDMMCQLPGCILKIINYEVLLLAVICLLYWIIFLVRNTLLVKWGDWTPFYLASGFESRGPTMNYMLCPPCPISCDCAQNKTRHRGLKKGFLLCRVRLPLLYKCAHYNFPFPSGDIFSVPTHIVKHTKRDLSWGCVYFGCQGMDWCSFEWS